LKIDLSADAQDVDAVRVVAVFILGKRFDGAARRREAGVVLVVAARRRGGGRAGG